MTDVPAAAGWSHCCGRQAGLQACHSELARAGLALSSHSFGLALHIGSAVPRRICVSAAASRGRRTDSFFFFLTHRKARVTHARARAKTGAGEYALAG